MAQEALPTTPAAPRTITVRVRTLLIAAAVILAAVLLRFTTLGVFHDTQAVPLGDLEPVMTIPRSSC